MKCHLRTKEHKKRAKVIKNDVPYTHEESLRAAGVKPALKTTAQAAEQKWTEIYQRFIYIRNIWSVKSKVSDQRNKATLSFELINKRKIQ